MGRNTWKLGLCLIAVDLLFAGCPAGSVAEELVGSRKVIEQVEQSISAAAEAKPTDPSQKLKDQLQADLKQYIQNAPSLKADEAADKWISLLDRYFAIPQDLSNPMSMYDFLSYRNRSASGEGLSFNSVMEAMPGPESWGPLSRQFEKRSASGNGEPIRNLGLKLLGYVLNNEPEKALNALAGFEKDGTGSLDSSQQSMATGKVTNIRTMIQESLGVRDANGMLKLFEDTLKVLKDSKTGNRSLKVPDLIGLAGRKKAEELIVEALRIPGVYVTVPGGGETLRLARSLVIRELDNIQLPQWGLIDSIDALPLYEALQKKFPPGKKSGLTGNAFIQSEGNDNYATDEQKARTYYILGLIAQDRIKDAVDIVRQADRAEVAAYGFNELASRVSGINMSMPLFNFYEEMRKVLKPFPLWQDYVALAISVGKTEQAVKALEAYPSAEIQGVKDRLMIDGLRVKAYLASDDVEKAVGILKEDLKVDASKEPDTVRFEIVKTKETLAKQLLQIGRLMKNPGWTEDGVAGIKASLEASENYGPALGSFWPDDAFINFLLEEKRFREAEAIIMGSMLNKIRLTMKVPDYGVDMIGSQLEIDLTLLLRTYEKAGRPEDVIFLLEHAPWFLSKDIKDLGSREITYLTASALHSLGRNAEAAVILKNYIDQNAGEDRAYQLLIDSSSDDLIPWLDKLYARDRFEERPLIWKAVLQLKAKQLDEAEKTVRTALKVDPTDGEQPKGDRVRAYAVLSDILEAKGDKENAGFFRRVVQAVRLAETGDDYTDAGLIKRSISYYEQAESLFTDAYCVQWRLAERFYALGQFEEAKKHYRIAFERMPEQFGQVASFCFGCQGVFERDLSRSIAEETLTHLEQVGVKRPQVYFLLGQLREAEERYQEAYGYYQKALAMDPEYLDVWAKLYNLKEKLFLSQKEAEDISFKILSLDPLMKHYPMDFSRIFDIKRLWSALEAIQKYYAPEVDHWFILTASKNKIEEKSQKSPFYSYRSDYSSTQIREGGRPYRYLGAIPLFNAILALISQNGAGMGYYE